MTARCSRPLLCMYVDARVCVTDRHACSMGTAVTVHILEKKIGGTAEAEDE